MTIAVIALGSNLQNPAEQVKNALTQLAKLPEITSINASSLYLSAPVGYTEQPDFINAVAIIETNYSAETLLQQLQKIEQQFGRERKFRNAPRTLDLDIIDYDGVVSNDALLTLPHPRAHERSFVMLPLAEIAPHYLIGQYGSAAEIANRLDLQGIEIYLEK